MSEYNKDNIFAKILRGEAPCVKIYEDAYTLAFMDVMPQAEGHVLVIPKAEACDIMDLDGAMAQKLIVNVQKIARAVKSALGCPGVMLAQLNGSAAGQTVFHCHIHLIPRREGDVENPKGGVRGVIPNMQKYGKDAIRIWEGGNFY